VTVEDLLTARHESGHCAAAILMGRRVRKVAVYGQHGIASGHGVCDSTPRPDETPAERLVVLMAGILYEPTHASGDLQTVERLRRTPGMQAVIDEATRRASKMIATPQFRRVAWTVEKQLWGQPILYEEDVLEIVT
jgi:hypothetical protein